MFVIQYIGKRRNIVIRAVLVWNLGFAPIWSGMDWVGWRFVFTTAKRTPTLDCCGENLPQSGAHKGISTLTMCFINMSCFYWTRTQNIIPP